MIRFMHEKNRPNRITHGMREFNDVINQCDLRDSPLLKAKFTWTDGKDNPLLSWLDRFLMSNCWEEVYPHFTQEVIPKIASDHWPIMINTAKVNYGPISFRFENMWVQRVSFFEKTSPSKTKIESMEQEHLRVSQREKNFNLE